MEFAEFVNSYLTAVKHRLRSYRQIRWRMQKFLACYAGKQLAEIRRQDITNYIDKRIGDGLANGTINLEIATLSAAYNYAIKHWGWEIINPVSGQYLRSDEGRLRWLNEREKRQLATSSQFKSASIYLPDFITLASNTGCRKMELLTLSWRNVDFDQDLIVIESKSSKNGKRRIIPLNKKAKQALQNRMEFNREHCPSTLWVFAKKDGKRLTTIDKQFRHCTKRAGIEDFRIHDLRHTFASWLVSKEVPLLHVKELLGHSSIKMTERYAHLAITSLAKAVAVLDEPDSA